MTEDNNRDPGDEDRQDGDAEPGGRGAPKRNVQDILSDYRASRGSDEADEACEDAEEDEAPEKKVGSAAGRREALRCAGVQSSLLDIEEKHERAMHEAIKFLPSAADKDDEQDQ